MDYLADIGINILIFVGLAVSLNLLMGFAGQVSMAHATFYGIGAYTAGILAIRYGWPTLPAIVVGVVLSFACASFVSLPAGGRVRGEYLILLTLSFQVVFSQLLVALRDFTGGPYGLSPVPPIVLFGQTLTNPTHFFLLLLIVTSAIVAATWALGESPFGRLLKGIREDEPVVKSLGKNTTAYKLIIFGISSAIAGLVGAISAYYYQFIAPGSYSLDYSISAVAIVVLGGLGNLTGSVIAAVILGSLRPLLQHVSWIGLEKSFYWQTVFYGLALVVLLRLRPQGILPEGVGIATLFRRDAGLPARTPDRGKGAPPVAAASTTEQVAKAGAGKDTHQPEWSRQGPALHHASTPIGLSVLPSADRSAEASDGKRPEVLRTVDLVKQFGGIQAVDQVNLTLRHDQITALIGPNGAGKTTIFNLITGTITPDRGQVLLRGEDIIGKPPNEVAKLGVVRLFQAVRLFQRLTVLDNVAMAVPNQSGESPVALALNPFRARQHEGETLTKAKTYLDLVGMIHRGQERVADLSYAEQKLVAIARLLATEAGVLLLDEPTSGIDPTSLDKMISLVRGLCDLGRTICIVEHNLLVVERLADHVVFMEQGRVTAEGNIGDLKQDARLAEVYFGQ